MCLFFPILLVSIFARIHFFTKVSDFRLSREEGLQRMGTIRLFLSFSTVDVSILFLQLTVHKTEAIHQSSFMTHQLVTDTFLLPIHPNWTVYGILGSLLSALIQLFKSRTCHATIYCILSIYGDSYTRVSMSQLYVVLPLPRYHCHVTRKLATIRIDTILYSYGRYLHSSYKDIILPSWYIVA